MKSNGICISEQATSSPRRFSLALYQVGWEKRPGDEDVNQGIFYN